MRQDVNFGKLGQMKIQQTAFMIIILTLFFVLVGLFVLSYSFSGLKQQKETSQEAEAIKLVSRLANVPELYCENAFGKDRTNCIDLDKAMALKNNGKEYSSFFGVTNIEIIKLYPIFENEKDIPGYYEAKDSTYCTEENYPNCKILRIMSNSSLGYDRSTFVTICHKESYFGSFYDKCELAKLVVRFSE